jgi:DUF1365 family protein
MTSCLYTGTVMHARRSPVRNVFSYGVFNALIDLDEVATLHRRLRLLSYNRRGVFSLRDRDYLDASPTSLAAKARSFVQARGVEVPAGPVLLLTNLRLFGYVFNPISLFYLLDGSGGLAVILAEVSNTFGQRHTYMLEPSCAEPHPHLRVYTQRKRLHVSPFFGMEQEYRFVLSDPGAQVYVRIDVREAGSRPFHATLVGRRRALTDRALAGVLVRYPLMTLRVTGLIHWQALRLWWKRAPLHRKPPFRAGQGSAW